MGLALSLLAACEETSVYRPAPKAPAPKLVPVESEMLATYYSQVQADLLARGLLRTDGGGPDTPFTPDMLARNFEQIAFYDEYVLDAGLERASATPGQLRRWEGPVRVSLEFGPSVTESKRATDRETVAAYIPRLARVTGHPVRQTNGSGNFHILVMGSEDRAALEKRLDTLLPNASAQTRALFTNAPRSIYCFVVAQASGTEPNVYTSAVALIRAEHPDLLRKSCLHEEIAQGLGLTNDSPRARPSIFNDDEEFALLTTHDEMLLSMLYDPRLASGMNAEDARPVLYPLAREQTGQGF
ncbi:DUF2927 domain-containing protein [Shimia sp. MMG029]|nr:DUF2927 domain-containing protein [Shimia sp. MMG029]MDA5558103.1 DUF2927 domain-containing protein [Shimia sp. MMG029]